MSLENASEVIAGDMEPLPYFPPMVTHFTTFPVPRAPIEELGADWTQPGNMVSNGAYALTEHVPQEKLARERNVNYWDNENTIIEMTTSLVINDENVALTRFLARELDRTEGPSGQFPALQENYPDDIMSVPNACSYYYTVNMTQTGNPALQDPNVRKALSLAVDSDVIVDNELAGGQKAAYTFTHWATAGFEAHDIPMATTTLAERNARRRP